MGRLAIVKLVLVVIIYLIVIVVKLLIVYIYIKTWLKIRIKLCKWRFKRTLYKRGLPRELVIEITREYSYVLDSIYSSISIGKLLKQVSITKW